MALTLKLAQTLKLQQTLKLTPQLQLAMKMLQLNQLELSELLKQEVEKNPLLEVEQEGEDAKKAAKESEKSLEAANEPLERQLPEKQEVYEVDWQKYLDEAQDNYFDQSPRYYDGEGESNLEEYVSSKESLANSLTTQLRLSASNETERKIGEYLIGMMNRSGYLVYDEEPILETLGVAKEQLERVVSLIQTFDPPGIGARNLTECLLLQYRAQQDRDPFVELLIESYLPELANNKVRQIARKEGVEIQTVLDAYEEIKNLDPKPGLHFGHEGKADYVTPDVFVRKVKGELEVTLNERYVPRLRINKFYRSMLRAEKVAPKQTISYIKQKLNAARFLMDSVERRKDTIFNVTKRIFEIQDGFFESGVRGLKPLVLKDVAEHCDLHESTVSRVTTSKYVQTPRGLFQLKFFFSSGTETTEGEAISSKHIRSLIQEMVDGENPKKPLSDSKIVKLLEDKGIEIARRTVAKYREELGIRSSSKRRQFV